jgi:hypothetical protein
MGSVKRYMDQAQAALPDLDPIIASYLARPILDDAWLFVRTIECLRFPLQLGLMAYACQTRPALIGVDSIQMWAKRHALDVAGLLRGEDAQ